MAFCQKCGAQLDGALKFCTNCGTPTAQQPPQYQQQQQPYMQPPVQRQQPYIQPPVQQPPAPVKRKSKAPLVAVVLVLVVGLTAAGIFTNGFGLFGGNSVAVSGITGFNAVLGGQTAKMGVKLTAGSRLTTGGETCVYLEVGKNSIVKMDENSEISVAEIKGSVLKFDLVRGSVLINENGRSGRVQMTAGNNRLVVRGTFFTAKYDGGDMTVDLIEGEIDVTTDSGEVTNVRQGKRVTVRGDGAAEVDALDAAKFDSFTKGSVMEYRDDLSGSSLSEREISEIADSWRASAEDNPVYDGGTREEGATAIQDEQKDGDDSDGGGDGGDDRFDGGGMG